MSERIETDKHTKIDALVKNLAIAKKAFDESKNRLSICTIKFDKDSIQVKKAKDRLHWTTCKYHVLIAQLKKLDPTNELVKDIPEKRKHKVDHKHVADDTKRGLDTVSGVRYNDEASSSTDDPEKVVVLARTRRQILVSINTTGLFSYLELLAEHDDNFVMIKKKKSDDKHNKHHCQSHLEIIGTGINDGNIFKNEKGKLHVLCVSSDKKIPVYCNHVAIRETLTDEQYIRWKSICRNVVMRMNLSTLGDSAKIFYCNDKNCMMASKGFIAIDKVTPLRAHDMVILWRNVSIECPFCKKSVISMDETTKRTEKLIEEITRKCPSCGTPVMRYAGCYHMQCPHCKKDWCWNCGKLRDSNDPYNHTCSPELIDEVSRRYDHPHEVWVEGLPPLTEAELRLNGVG